MADLEQQRLRLIELQTALADADDQLRLVRSDLPNTLIRSPIDGVVLRLRTRAGERPSDDGVLEVGAIQQMRAELEVVESDIARLRLGQSVVLRSEDGAFPGSLRGRVAQISPQIRQREVPPTTAPADVDARVVLVRVDLDPADRVRVSQLQGAKLIARIAP
ncbi:MAG: HlyD family efflux transporter periplasmic adaptor subunit [Cyanobacteriota bacterium]